MGTLRILVCIPLQSRGVGSLDAIVGVADAIGRWWSLRVWNQVEIAGWSEGLAISAAACYTDVAKHFSRFTIAASRTLRTLPRIVVASFALELRSTFPADSFSFGTGNCCKGFSSSGVVRTGGAGFGSRFVETILAPVAVRVSSGIRSTVCATTIFGGPSCAGESKRESRQAKQHKQEAELHLFRTELTKLAQPAK